MCTLTSRALPPLVVMLRASQGHPRCAGRADYSLDIEDGDLAIVSVWTAEALNTAFEFLTDVASPSFHPIAGQAKDVAAGAVLLAASESRIALGLLLGPAARS